MITYAGNTAAGAGMSVCHVCGSVDSSTQSRCELCGMALHVRKPSSVQRSVAFLLTAMVLYVPASILPIMETHQLGHVRANTIAGGVVLLWHHGSYPIALVIFIASVLVPVLKMVALAFLCASVARQAPIPRSKLSTLYGMTELVGKWSMVDVFVVALLVALIQISGLLAIKAGAAALAFAGVVVFTMLAARAFDSRLIWDQEESS